MKNYQLTIFIIIVCIVSLLLETTIINFPFIFLIGAITSVLIKRIPVFIGVFILSFAIDSMRVVDFGLTALFIFVTVSLILLYEKYSGSDDLYIASFIIAVMLFLYAHLLSYSVTLVILFYILSLTGLYVYGLLKKKGVVA